MRLYDLAHARAGDKGNTSNISVTAYRAEDYPLLVALLTEARVLAAFRHLGAVAARRYALPKLHALNFVIEGVLGGGVTRSLRIDPHGKALSALMLTIELGNQLPPGRDAGVDADAGAGAGAGAASAA